MPVPTGVSYIGLSERLHVRVSDRSGTTPAYVHVYEGRFDVPAFEMTTGEVVGGLRGAGVPEDAVQTFGRFASRCDLVKFAKLWPGPDACRDSLEAARTFVDQTRPRGDHLDWDVGSGNGAGFGASDLAAVAPHGEEG